MDISNINGISTGDIKSFFNNTSLTKTDKTDSFSDVLSAAMGSIGETNDLQNAAAQEEVRFLLGICLQFLRRLPITHRPPGIQMYLRNTCARA